MEGTPRYKSGVAGLEPIRGTSDDPNQDCSSVGISRRITSVTSRVSESRWRTNNLQASPVPSDILAIVEFLDEDTHHVHYVRRPFQREPDFGVTSVNYDFAELLARAEAPGP